MKTCAPESSAMRFFFFFLFLGVYINSKPWRREGPAQVLTSLSRTDRDPPDTGLCFTRSLVKQEPEHRGSQPARSLWPGSTSRRIQLI